MLSQPDVVYTVRCTAAACNCRHFGVDCRRGFFSLWVQAVYGLYFAQKLNINCQIDFGDKPYLYSDPARFKGSLNFWNYYYIQNAISKGRAIPNNYEECYPLRIWKRSHFRKVHKSVVKNLELIPDADNYIQQLVSSFKGHKTLGVHIRRTDHSQEVPAVALERYRQLLSKHIKNFELFFIATDDQQALEWLTNEFGSERIVYQKAVRSQNQQAVHTDFQHEDRYGLGLEVLADGYALAACDKAILVHSNVSYGALLLNPELPYKLLETSQSFKNRWKTGLLYTLDRWGLRKM